LKSRLEGVPPQNLPAQVGEVRFEGASGGEGVAAMQRMHYARGWGAALALLLGLAALGALAGCASGATARTATATPGAATPLSTPAATASGNPSRSPHDFCALVTPADVHMAINVVVQPPQGHLSADANIGADADGPRTFTELAGCRYAAASGPALVALDYYFGLAPDIAAVYANRRGLAPHPQAVAGLGDAAYWDGATLGVLRGGDFAQITIQDAPGLAPGSAALLAGERWLAAVILARL
jgi:hypothetical protein